MAEKRIIANNGSSIVLYTTDDGNTQLEVKFGGSKWFANEKDDSFKSCIGQIYQTFGGEDLYSSVEKRQPCSSFGSWKRMNGIYGSNGHKHITDNTLDIIAVRCEYDLTNHHHALANAEACAAIALERYYS